MKTMKKLFSIVLVLALVLSLGISAWATGIPLPENGSITVENATIGETYRAFKLFDATLGTMTNAEGEEEVVISYLATANQKDFFEGTSIMGNPFTFTGPNSGGMYTVGVKDAFKDDTSWIITFLKGYIQINADGTYTSGIPDIATPVVIKAETDEVKFKNLPFGYYFVTSTVGTVVTINSTMPDVTVIDKNQKPKFDKTMQPVEGNEFNHPTDGAPANDGHYGDVIDYTITLDATNYDGEMKNKSYYVLDQLDKGLSYTNGEVEVKVDGQDVKRDVIIKWYKDNTVVEKPDPWDSSAVDSFSVYIPWVDTDGNHLYNANSVITIKYKATIDVDAVIGKDGNWNIAKSWNSDKDEEPTGGPEPSKEWGHDMGEEKTVTYTYAVALLKVDPNLDKLAGAEFEITNKDKKVAAKKNPKGEYEFVRYVDEEHPLTADETAAGVTTTFVTDNNGEIILKGVDQGSYVAKETKAPNGFNLYDGTLDLKAETIVEKTESEYSYATEWYVEKDSAGNIITSTSTHTESGYTQSEVFDVDVEAAAYAIENNQGAELPETGGIGTTILYVVGGVLVAVAVIFLITKKRMGKAQR